MDASLPGKCILTLFLKAPKLYMAGNMVAGRCGISLFHILAVRIKNVEEKCCQSFLTVYHIVMPTSWALSFYARKVNKAQGYAVPEHSHRSISCKNS